MDTTSARSPLLDVPAPEWVTGWPDGLTLDGFGVKQKDTLRGESLIDTAPRCGLAVEDVRTIEHLSADVNEVLAREVFRDGLCEAAEVFGSMSLRAGVGWVFVDEGDPQVGAANVAFYTMLENGPAWEAPALVRWLTGSAPGVLMRDVDAAWREIAHLPGTPRSERTAGDGQKWDRPEATALANVGWLFAAAGISRAEAEALAADGVVDWEVLLTLAALRDVPIPATR
jgi:hypothetical protein